MPRAARISVAAGLILCAALAAFGQGSASGKRPLSHKDYDSWRTISGSSLSRNGKFLAYSFMPQEGDGDVIVRDLTTGKETRIPAGAVPPAPPPSAEASPDAEPPRRAVRILFTSDSRYLLAATFPSKAETDQARKERKRADEMPKNRMVILDLQTMESQTVNDVRSMQVPTKGGAWVAYLKEPKPGERPAAPAKPSAGDAADGDESEIEGEDQQRGGARSGAGTGGAGRREFGTELVLRDLSKKENNERSFQSVLEYSFARDGKSLLYTVSSRTDTENGIYSVTPGTDAAPVALLAGKGKYSRLSWDREQEQLAFVSDKDDAASRTPKSKIYLWDRKSGSVTEAVSASTPGFKTEFVVSDRAPLSFSRDGKKLYVSAGNPPSANPQAAAEAEGPAAPAAPGAAANQEPKVLADLWHWKDDMLQPMQKVRANQERNRTWRGVYHIAEKKYVQIADRTMNSFSPSDDGTLAFGMDDRSYRRLADYDTTYNDVYLVDTATGTRKLVMKKFRGGGGGGGAPPAAMGLGGGGGGPLAWSPNGKYALYYQDKNWHLFDIAAGASKNLTGGMSVPFYNDEDDHPDVPPSLGNAGWTKDSRSFLLYDRYDVWQFFVDGAAPKNITEGNGRKEKIQYRVARLDISDNEDDDDRGIDPAKPLYLRAVHLETRDTGIFRDSLSGNRAPEKLLWGAKNFNFAGKAMDADVVLLTASRFDEFPDLHTTDLTFKTLKKVSDGGAQTKPFIWGKSELVKYRNVDGVPLQGILIKPENFDPKKKYPLMVYIYERLTQGLHNFTNPGPGSSINYSYYVSNGYLILMPDIVYTVGHPGQSALKCVLPAIQEVVDMGIVDEKAIGIQGHSWGGYQIAYMITQTNRFRAAEAGAPVGNMTSAYSGIRWGSGMPRQFQYERTQSRIGGSLWERPLQFIENSPVFHAHRVQTPLLILHDDADDAVPWYQGIELFLALRRNEKEVYMFNYNNELHGLRQRHNQKDYTVRMQQFFDHFLKGAPKPEWMEKGIPFIEREEEKERFKTATDGR